MKNLIKAFCKGMAEIIVELFTEVIYFCKNNIRNFAWLLNITLPYIMYIIGQYVHDKRGEILPGGEIFIPIIFGLIICLLRSYANKIGKGTKVPIPPKRFTYVDDDGEVTISYHRIQELILYLADLEDWLERKGLL